MDAWGPTYDHLGFASLGHLPIPLDVVPEYRAVENGGVTQAAASLKAKYRTYISLLDKRLKSMTSALREANVSLGKLLGTVNVVDGF